MPELAPCDVHYDVSGPRGAPVLVLASSLGTSLRMWDPQLPALAERFRVVRYDQRGHGASPVPAAPYDIDDLGRDVLALLDRLGIERASLCGLSLGGMVAMWVAANVPERVERLVLCCTSAHLPPPETWEQRAAMVVEAQTTAAVAESVLGRWLTPAYAASHPATVARLRAMLVSTSPEGYAACCGVIQRLDLRDALASIEAPTLVIAGADDQATPPSHGQQITDAVAGARLEVLESAAHLANVERAAALARLVAEHLER